MERPEFSVLTAVRPVFLTHSQQGRRGGVVDRSRCDGNQVHIYSHIYIYNIYRYNIHLFMYGVYRAKASP